MRHAYTLWTTDTRFPGGQYVKDTYQARQDEIIRRELSLDFDTPKQCHARARVRHNRLMTNERRHSFQPGSPYYSDTGQCRTGDCNVVETAGHLLLDCPQFEQLRFQLRVQLDALTVEAQMAALTLPMLTGQLPPTLRKGQRGKWYGLTADYILAVTRRLRL